MDITSEIRPKYLVGSIGYIGKKKLDFSDIINKYNINRYIEPFAGSFNCGYKLIEKNTNCKEFILNDKDEQIYNLHKVLNNNYDEFVSRLKKLGHLDENIDEEMFKIDGLRKSSDNINRAIGTYMFIKVNSFTKGYSTNLYNEVIDTIDAYNDIKANNLIITNEDYEDILNKYDTPDTFIFMDPPYLVKNVGNYYNLGGNWFYHKKFADYVKGLKNAKWIVSYNDSDIINEYFKDYKRRVVTRCVYFVDSYIKSNNIELEDLEKLVQSKYEKLYIEHSKCRNYTVEDIIFEDE